MSEASEGPRPFRPVEPGLADLARAYGVAVEYYDQGGTYHAVSADTVEAVLAAMDVDASTEESRWVAWERLRERDWRRVLPPVFVARAGTESATWVHVPHGAEVQVVVELEDGSLRRLQQVEHLVEPREIDGTLVGEARFAVPVDLPLGWHTLRVVSEHAEGTAPLAVTPARLELPSALRDRRLWGLMAQLYAVRSRRSWGTGDLVDLADLGSWAGRTLGAGFVLVNPLHAASPVPPMAPSPYLPATRRFFNPLYLRVEAVPEYSYLDEVARTHVDSLGEACRALNTRSDLLDRDLVWAAKREALQFVHNVPLTPGRMADYEAFLAREGDGLLDFATWSAFVEEHGTVWTLWPEELRDPRSEATAAERVRLAGLVDFHRWMQWLLDEQLAAAGRALADAGMPGGVVHDLAVGVHPDGSDSWSLQHVLAQGVSVGAPPDMYNQVGQDWSQPPWRPDRLAEVGFAPYRDLLRGILRHAGGIRVDHVLGLFRLWWVPAGRPANEGTYVVYDHEAMVGILALEAHRAGAFVVGEDLGTVEEWVQHLLLDRGVLGTSILWFERDDDDLPLPPERWRGECLASVTVHDLPPTVGYLEGVHVDLRDRLGLLTRPLDQERAAHEVEVAQWREALEARGLVEPGAGTDELVVGLHAYLAATPSRLLGVALPDLVGDRSPQNQPGTDQEYPNWRVPQCDGDGRAVLIEDLLTDPDLRVRITAIVSAMRPVGS
jgi:4-alpha-glucanotransferase